MVIPLSKRAFYFFFPSTTKLPIHTTSSTFVYVFTFSFTQFNSSVQTCNLFFTRLIFTKSACIHFSGCIIRPLSRIFSKYHN